MPSFNCTYTKIVAPVAGRTGALLVHPGSLVRANDSAALVVINQVAPAYVTFAVPARLLPQMGGGRARALKVLAVPAGTAEAAVTGNVSFVDNAVDQATDSVRIKAIFPNRDRRLWAGAFVDVTLQLAVEAHAVVVPNASVQASQQGQFVYVVKPDSTVEVAPGEDRLDRPRRGRRRERHHSRGDGRDRRATAAHARSEGVGQTC